MKRLAILTLSAIVLLIAATAIGQNAPPAPFGPGDSDNAEAAPQSCPARSLLVRFQETRRGNYVRDTPVWKMPDSSAFFFISGMMIDADGAPNAYNADNTGLDDLSNAGEPGNWGGVIQDKDGNPVVQGPDDPDPDYYISCTSLFDRTKSPLDPTRFVDASKIPYVVLPGDLARPAGARVGDFAFVMNLRNGKSGYAIFADVGALGEGSVALADHLGINSDARRGGARGGILYLVFPGSGDHSPKTIEEINAETDKLLQDFGGAEKLTSCAANQEPTVTPVATPAVASKPPEAQPTATN